MNDTPPPPVYVFFRDDLEHGLPLDADDCERWERRLDFDREHLSAYEREIHKRLRSVRTQQGSARNGYGADSYPDPDDELTADAFAQLRGVHVKTVQGWCRAGKLSARQDGHEWRIPRGELTRSIRRRSVKRG